ncbi:MAG: hypothetical protein JWO36_4927 [Myxococcales bacterium]|nr:hypothetical protein [Myxococcales bacterium]
MRAWMIITVATLAVASGCVSAQFHSKTGRTFAPITPRAVVVSEHEAGLVRGEVIGTITAKGPEFNDQRDLADEAARVAAANGGTHVIVTKEWAERYRYHHPATSSTDCTGYADGVSCQTRYDPASTTISKPMPRAEFLVIRLAAVLWRRLPPELRPASIASDVAPASIVTSR